MSHDTIATCMVSKDKINDDTLLSYGITILLGINILGIFILSIVLFLETNSKAHYHHVKNTPPKLKLTREYLEKLRPQKKLNSKSYFT